MLEQSLAAKKEFYKALGDTEVVEAMDRGYAEAGHTGAMKRAAETLSARPGYRKFTDIAAIYMQAGESQEALETLEKAYEERDVDLPYINVVAVFEPLRGNPRFQAIVHGMGLPL